MPEFPLALHDPDETLTITLSKRPTPGTWFDLGDVTVKVDDIRWIGSEPVISGSRVSREERASLLAGKAEGRRGDDETTIFDSTGLAIQDLAIALAAMERVDELDLPTIDL